MDEQADAEGNLNYNSEVEKQFKSKLDGALAAVKAIESAIKIAGDYALEIGQAYADMPGERMPTGSRRTSSPFMLRHVAELEIAIKKMRSSYFPETVLDDGGWNIMMDLFVQQQRGREVSISSACMASRVPPTTALRWIDILEAERIIVRENDPGDRRRRFVRLTDKAYTAMSEYLQWVAVTRYRAQD